MLPLAHPNRNPSLFPHALLLSSVADLTPSRVFGLTFWPSVTTARYTAPHLHGALLNDGCFITKLWTIFQTSIFQ